MIIKSYVADTAAEALKHIRSELGGDAVVLKTREVPSSGRNRRIEVTACIDRAKAPVRPAAAAQAPVEAATAVAEAPRAGSDVGVERMAEIERKLDRILQMNAGPQAESGEETAAFMQKLELHDFPHEFIEWCIGDASAGTNDGEGDAVDGLRAALERSLAGMMTEEIRPQVGERVVVFGLPGAGKTSVLGKLTARLVGQEGVKVRLMTLDNIKVGALDEIGSYSDLLGADLRLTTPTDKTTQGEHDDVVLLIDTAGFNGDADRMAAMESQLEALDPQYRVLVFSAVSRTADLRQLAGNLARLRPTHLVMTMTDLTERRGALAAISQGTGAPLVFLTDAPAGLGSLTAPEAAVMAEQILASGDDHE
jgi:flagellar biosynthesis protein FlhF